MNGLKYLLKKVVCVKKVKKQKKIGLANRSGLDRLPKVADDTTVPGLLKSHILGVSGANSHRGIGSMYFLCTKFISSDICKPYLFGEL